MIDMKQWGKRFLFPPLWLLMLLTVASAAALVAVFINEFGAHPVAYAVYVFSFYTVSVLTLFCIKRLPAYYRSIKHSVYRHPIGHRYMTDPQFRTRVSLYLSLAANLLYAVMNFALGVGYHSAWFYILFGYYGILAVMRFLLVRYVHKVGIGRTLAAEWRRARLCSAILLTVNLALTGAVLMMLYQNKGYEYHGILIYVMAMYTFYMTIHAVVELVRYRKFNSPVMSTAKIVSLAAALVSMLSLETAMLTEFAAEQSSVYFNRIMIAATGGGISLVIVTLSLYMIARSGAQLKLIKEREENGTS